MVRSSVSTGWVGGGSFEPAGEGLEYCAVSPAERSWVVAVGAGCNLRCHVESGATTDNCVIIRTPCAGNRQHTVQRRGRRRGPMQLTQHTDFGIRLLIALAQGDGAPMPST